MNEIQSMRILAADDDEIVLDIVENLLVADGHEVVTVSRGDDALDLLKHEDFQLAILDWEMPGKSGIELCQEIRDNSFGGYLYTILLTSRSSSEEMVEGMAAGADDFVTKPFNAAELRMRINAGARVLSLETRDMLIFTLAKLAESRDPDTGQHLERVQRYSRELAQKLAENPKYHETVDSRFVKNIFLTSPLHDIGKVGIPDSILLKHGRLTPEEFEVMKTHTTLGAQTLQEVARLNPQAYYLQMARDISLSHHEKYNGTGYPQRLSGDAIPLAARIVAVADVYDALTSKRVYKPAYSPEHARELIIKERGRHFDPDIVDAFVQVEDRFLEIFKTYNRECLLNFESLTSVV